MIPPRAQTTRFYRFVASGSLVLTVVILTAITYVAFSRAALTISLTSKPIQTTFSITVGQNEQAERHVQGLYLRTVVSGTKAITGTGGSETPAKARGIVRIVNQTSSSQPLAASTRLLSESGVLFRTTKRLDVPAGGSVDANVEADQGGTQGEIGPSKFTLPGLRPANQEKIYGTSSIAMTGGTVTSMQATDADRTSAQQALETELTAQALRDLEQAAKEQGLPFEVTVLSKDTTPLKFNNQSVNLQLTVQAITLDQQALQGLAKEELGSTIGQDEVVASLDSDHLSLSLRSADAKARSAVVAVTAQGTSTLAQTNPALAPERFAGKNRSDLALYAKATAGIDQIDVRLSPFWALHLPSQPNRIRITLQSALTPTAANSTVELPPQ